MQKGDIIANEKNYTVVAGVITKGAGIVSGRANDPLYGETGTIRRQIPVMMSVAEAMGNPMPTWFPDIFKGSLNVEIGSTTFDIIAPNWDFKALTWMYTDGIHPKYAEMFHAKLQEDPDLVRIFTALGLDISSMIYEAIIRQLHLKCENFKIIQGYIETAWGIRHPCLFYRPDPQTKGSVFHGDHCFEVLALPIPEEEVAEGCLVKIYLPNERIIFK